MAVVVKSYLTDEEKAILLAAKHKRQNLARKGQWFVEWGLVVDACERLAAVSFSIATHEATLADMQAADAAGEPCDPATRRGVLEGKILGMRRALHLLTTAPRSALYGSRGRS